MLEQHHSGGVLPRCMKSLSAFLYTLSRSTHLYISAASMCEVLLPPQMMPRSEGMRALWCCSQRELACCRFILCFSWNWHEKYRLRENHTHCIPELHEVPWHDHPWSYTDWCKKDRRKCLDQSGYRAPQCFHYRGVNQQGSRHWNMSHKTKAEWHHWSKQNTTHAKGLYAANLILNLRRHGISLDHKRNVTYVGALP